MTTHTSLSCPQPKPSIAPSEHAWYTPEAIAARAIDQGSCVWHAAWTLSVEHLNEMGYSHCRLCGGVTAPFQDDVHSLCLARERRGVAIPECPLDASPLCSCAPCMAAASE